MAFGVGCNLIHGYDHNDDEESDHNDGGMAVFSCKKLVASKNAV